MPHAVARHCSAPGNCPGYAVYRGRCEAHTPKRPQHPYGADWRRARIAYLLANPYCVCDTDCCPGERGVGVEGCGSVAVVVDHIIPHKGDMELFWDRENNWQSLTSACHSRKTAREVLHGAR